MKLAHCINCGCHDFAACYDEEAGEPCSWLAFDREAGVGVCSCCADAMSRWNAGDRTIAVPVEYGYVDQPVNSHDSIESLKSAMAAAICDWIKQDQLTQEQAAERLFLHRPRVSDLQRGRLEKFSVDALMTYLLRAGKDVHLSVR